MRWGAGTTARGFTDATEVLTLVPINLRPWSEQGLDAITGNRATGVMVKLPLGVEDRSRASARSTRVCERKASPALEHLPMFAEGLSLLPRPLVRALSLVGSRPSISS